MGASNGFNKSDLTTDSTKTFEKSVRHMKN